MQERIDIPGLLTVTPRRPYRAAHPRHYSSCTRIDSGRPNVFVYMYTISWFTGTGFIIPTVSHGSGAARADACGWLFCLN